MDKEYIEREAAKRAIYDYILEQTVSKYPSAELCYASRRGAEGAMYELDYVPKVDVVEVIRCKDCIYKQNAQINRKEFLICPASGIEITDDDYAVIEKGKTNDLQRLYSLCCVLEGKRSGNGKSDDNELSYLPSIQRRIPLY